MEHWCICEDGTCLGCSIDNIVSQYGKTNQTINIIRKQYGLLGLHYYSYKYLDGKIIN